MKLFILALLVFLSVLSQADECQEATAEATRIHMQYVQGQATLKQSYNATADMEMVCVLNDKKPEKPGKEPRRIASSGG